MTLLPPKRQRLYSTVAWPNCNVMNELLRLINNILLEKSRATPNCFPIYLVNAENMESCSIGSETGFISEQLCMKTFMVAAASEE